VAAAAAAAAAEAAASAFLPHEMIVVVVVSVLLLEGRGQVHLMMMYVVLDVEWQQGASGSRNRKKQLARKGKGRRTAAKLNLA
jgi:hypothetical protein